MTAKSDRTLWLSSNALQHEPGLRAWLARRRVPGLEIDDIVQETYVRLASVEAVECISNVKRYMFQAAISVVLSHLRRRNVVSFQLISGFETMEFAEENVNPERQVIDRDELERLIRALDKLPQNFRDVLVLRRIHGLSQRETSTRLNLPETTVEQRLSRGLRQLMRIFLEEARPLATKDIANSDALPTSRAAVCG